MSQTLRETDITHLHVQSNVLLKWKRRGTRGAPDGLLVLLLFNSEDQIWNSWCILRFPKQINNKHMILLINLASLTPTSWVMCKIRLTKRLFNLYYNLIIILLIC